MQTKNLSEIRIIVEPNTFEGWYEGTHYRIENLFDWTKTVVYYDVGKKKEKWIKLNSIISRIVIDVSVGKLTTLTISFSDGLPPTKEGK